MSISGSFLRCRPTPAGTPTATRFWRGGPSRIWMLGSGAPSRQVRALLFGTEGPHADALLRPRRLLDGVAHRARRDRRALRDAARRTRAGRADEARVPE